ncbi:Oidioi.mRNA.OKI2018_I69.XSR.g14730.t1.cds [Oikopleura dioica]|uniref:Oidioi.mRNA.OKI2018_I69.XSR.g14730.t1.cds n=1 Tax=Oikopleura dioica TaxID=34765 RepID=A0ABN7SAM4_OIKDI|nr:Oidioi.mRNA.OKI2018_I69.XSR.g14730.t1.cds [Oikopleura dioica]
MKLFVNRVFAFGSAIAASAGFSPRRNILSRVTNPNCDEFSLAAAAECEDECDVDLVLCINQCNESQDPTNCSRNCFDVQEKCRRGCPCHDGCYNGCEQCPEVSQCINCLPESECRDACTDKLCADQIKCEIYNSYCMDDARRTFDACEGPNGIAFVDCPYETESISKCSNIYGGGICCWNENTGKCGKVNPYGEF